MRDEVVDGKRKVHIPQGVVDASRALLLVIICVSLWRVAVAPSISLPSGTIAIPSQTQTLSGRQLMGAASAPVGIIVFSDFECPSCKLFAESVLPTIVTKYVAPGSALVAFSHLPLLEMHPAALRRATIAECAGRQGRFWEVHDRLFASQSDSSVEDYSVDLLDGAELGRCLSSGVEDDILVKASQARELGVTATPSIFVGEVRGSRFVVTDTFVGLQSIERLSGVIERLLHTRSRGS